MSKQQQLTCTNLWTLEEYAEKRIAFRREVLAHKQQRRVLLGDHLQLIFEDRLTIQYQIQEMLRVERTFETAGIVGELAAYNPLIPDGNNWKCTLLIQYQDVAERKIQLGQLIGIETKIWVKIGTHKPVFAIADEDMNRTNETKTSAVHFLRFQLNSAQVSAAKQGQTISMGVTHPAYQAVVLQLTDSIAAAILKDLA